MKKRALFQNSGFDLFANDPIMLVLREKLRFEARTKEMKRKAEKLKREVSQPALDLRAKYALPKIGEESPK